MEADAKAGAGPVAAPAAAVAAAAGGDKKAARQTKRKRDAAGEAEAPEAKAAKTKATCLAILGLGNAGEAHSQQRHNIGARAVATLAARLGAEVVADVPAASGARRKEGGDGRPVLLLAPQGPINDSGKSLQAALAALGHESAAFLVVVDDCSLPAGTIRLRAKGSCGGHNGLRDVEAAYGQDYHRLKLGVGGKPTKDSRFPVYASNFFSG